MSEPLLPGFIFPNEFLLCASCLYQLVSSSHADGSLYMTSQVYAYEKLSFITFSIFFSCNASKQLPFGINTQWYWAAFQGLEVEMLLGE